MDWVFDCSVALALGLPDEHSPRAEVFVESLGGAAVLWVPALWWYEAANALAMARRRKRASEADVARMFELFHRLPLETDAELDSAAALRFHVLAQAHGISAYDAAYLELASRKGLGLATLDRRLAKAARNSGIRVFE